MGRKSDLKEVDAVADEFRMTDRERIEFGDYLEDCKAHGERGSKNPRGDFTWTELVEKAREFMGEGEGE